MYELKSKNGLLECIILELTFSWDAQMCCRKRRHLLLKKMKALRGWNAEQRKEVDLVFMFI